MLTQLTVHLQRSFLEMENINVPPKSYNYNGLDRPTTWLAISHVLVALSPQCTFFWLVNWLSRLVGGSILAVGANNRDR